MIDRDIRCNNLFCLWGVVLQQQKKGVPIGGFLSAQLMCLWALICEYSFLESEDKRKFLAPVFHAWSAHIPQPQFKPGPTLTFPFVANAF